ncbi:DNRLRE domain-containing protein [Paenibacillus tengchongensis]|uniref:DNRLRE domain-containing protein n=1 Tax=Paenibacillus tengchongensis TaxID=2608684 RepID=UPI00124E2FEE|nr:DNRLRE domain-containing protein [Paenibacillus tengchongensis]
MATAGDKFSFSSTGTGNWGAPESGRYLIEVKGAGSSNGGTGGTAKGEIVLSKGELLSITIGGQTSGGRGGSYGAGTGTTGGSYPGTGYNGYAGSNGGGGSYIKRNNAIIIAAGGGGGKGGNGGNASTYNSSYVGGSGGAGGNAGSSGNGAGGNGGNGGVAYNNTPIVKGGAGTAGTAGSTVYDGGGGGGGGGGAAYTPGNWYAAAGSGGNGGTGGLNYINTAMFASTSLTGANAGSGSAMITLLGVAPELKEVLVSPEGVITAGVSDPDPSTVQHRIIIDGTEVTGWSALQQVPYDIVYNIPDAQFQSKLAETAVRVELKDSSGLNGEPWSGSVPIRNLAGSINVKQVSEAVSQVYILFHEDMDTTFTVRESDGSALTGYVQPVIAADTPCSLSVGRLSDLDSAMAVRENNTAEAGIFIWGIRSNELNSSLLVNQNKDYHMESRIAVREANTADGTISIWGVRDAGLPSCITAVFPEHADSRWSLRLRSGYVKWDTSDGICYGFDRAGIMQVIGDSSSGLPGRIGVRFRNRVIGVSDIIGSGGCNLDAAIIVKQVFDLPMSLGVTAGNKMRAIVDIQPPTRLTEVIPVNGDLFIREAYPKLNYGSEQTLLAGYSSARSEIFRSLIGFSIGKIASMSSNYVVERVVVKLRHTLGKTPVSALELRSVTGTWSEYGTTWANQPINGEIIAANYTADPAGGFITFDITDFIRQALEQGAVKVDLCLRSVNEFEEAAQFFSKEAGSALAPSIEYTYFDDVIRSTGRSGIDTRILIMYPAFITLGGKINIFKKSGTKDLSSKANVTPSGNRYENVHAQLQITRPEIAGQAIVQVKTDSHLRASIAIREQDMAELEHCSIRISLPSISSQLYANFRKDLPSQVGARVWTEEQLYGWIALNIKERPGSISIRPYTDVAGSVTVRREGKEDLHSFMGITETVRCGSIDILNHKDFGAEITVQGTNEDSISSVLAVNQFQFAGRIKVIPYVDFAAKLTVRHSGEASAEGRLTVSCPDLAQQLYIRFRSVLAGQLAVRHTGWKELGGQGTVSRPDVPASIHPLIHSDCTGEIAVRRLGGHLTAGRLYVPYRNDLSSEMSIVGASMLRSVILVNSGYLNSVIRIPVYADDTLRSSFSTRLSGNRELFSTIEVFRNAFLGSKLSVRNSAEGDTVSKLTVRKKNDTGIPSSMDIWRFHAKIGRILVRRHAEKLLPAGLEVLQSHDLKFMVDVPHRKELQSKMRVQYAADAAVPAQLQAKIRAYSDMSTSLDVTLGGHSDMVSNIGVFPLNRMSGIVDLKLPVRELVTLAAVKDAYVREDVPTLNYGEETSFAVGSYKGATLSAMLGFDLSGLEQSYEIEKVELQIYYGKEPQKALRLMEAGDTWTELGVTWLNKPAAGSLIQAGYSVDTEKGCISFDVTSYVLAKYLNKDKKADFYLLDGENNSEGYDYFLTKEALLHAPELAVVYYNPAVWSGGRATLDSRFTIPMNAPLSSRVRVRKPDITTSGIYSELTITRNNILDGMLAVSRPSLDASCAVSIRMNTELTSALSIISRQSESVAGAMTVSHPDILSGVNVKSRSDFTGAIAVRRPVEEAFYSWIQVSTKEKQGTLYVPPSSDIELRFTVRGEHGGQLHSIMAINRAQIGGAAIVTQIKPVELISGISVRRSLEKPLESRMTVSHSENRNLYSEATVSGKVRPGALEILSRNDVTANIEIQALYGLGEIATEIRVTRASLGAALEALSRKSLPSVMHIVPMRQEWVAGVLEVSRRDLQAEFNIRHHSDLLSELGVGQWLVAPLATKLTVSSPSVLSSIRVTLPADIGAQLRIRAGKEEEINCGAFISQPSVPGRLTIMESSGMPAEIGVQHTADSSVPVRLTVSRAEAQVCLTVVPSADIQSNLTVVIGSSSTTGGALLVRFRNDVVSTLEIWGAGLLSAAIRVISGNLASQIAIPAYVDDMLPSCLGIRSRFISEIPSALQVQEWSQFSGTIQPRVYGSSNRSGSLLIYAIANDDLAGSVDIQYFRQAYLKSSIAVRIQNTMDGGIEIIGRGAGDLTSVIRPVVNHDILGLLGVRFDNRMTGKSDFIPVGDSVIHGGLDVLPAVNLTGSIVIMHSGNSGHPGTITVRTRRNVDLQSSVNIVYGAAHELRTAIGIPALNRMAGTVFIIPVKDADLQSCVEAHVTSNCPAVMTVRRSAYRDLTALVEVHHYYEVPGEIAIRREGNSVRPATLTARQSGVSERPGRMTVKTFADSDIGGSINTIQFRLLSARLSVRRSLWMEIASKMEVLNRHDLDSAIKVKQTGSSSLSSAINTLQFSTLPGIVRIRRTAGHPLNSRIYVLNRKDIPSVVSVPLRSDIPGSMDVVAEYGYCYIM